MAKPSLPRCPDMELAPARDYHPDILLPAPGEPPELVATKEFVLLMGLAFNDIKALLWASDQLLKGAPPVQGDAQGPQVADPYTGNWFGTFLTFERHYSGVLDESYYIVDRYSRQGVFKTSLFSRALKRMGQNHRQAWSDCLADAIHPATKRQRGFHHGLRNSVSYHYSQAGKLMTEAYRKHVGLRPGDPRYERAWASFGHSLEASRFYFSDAAADVIQEDMAAKSGHVTPEERRKNISNLSIAVRMLLEQLLGQLANCGPGGSAPI